MTETSGEKFWLELREPHCVPERKGPWPSDQTASVLREVMEARPTAKITVITISNGEPHLQDGPQCLGMADGRAMSRASRHIKTSNAALASPSTQEPALRGGKVEKQLVVENEAHRLATQVIPAAMIFADEAEHIEHARNKAAEILKPYVAALRTYAGESAAQSERAGLEQVLEPFAEYSDKNRRLPAEHIITQGSRFAKRQLTMGDCYAAADALRVLSAARKAGGE